MVSKPDDNPFARASVWPKMPQAPFRVGSLPRAADSADDTAPQPAPPERRTITPAFVRPTEGAFTPAFTRPAAATPQPLRQPDPPPPSPPPEVPLIAVAVRPVARKPRRWSGLIATAVGLAGLAGLVLVFTQRQPPAPVLPARVVVAQAVAPAPPLMEAPVATPLAVTPQRLARTSLAKAPAAQPSSRAALATQEALDAPVLALPPAVPVPPPLRLEAAPDYQPPPAPDPNAPITTRAPYS